MPQLNKRYLRPLGLLLALLLPLLLATAALADGVWKSTTSLSTTRRGHTATTVEDSNFNTLVLTVGGINSSGNTLASAELYDQFAGSGTWTAAASLATARSGHTATRLVDGKVLVVGGLGSSGNVLASAELYDPIANTWTAAASLATARSGHTATLANGKVLVVGGIDSGGNTLASAELYDPTANTWTAAASLNTGRQVHTATSLTYQSPHKVLVVGGIDSGGNTLASAELYDPDANTWTPTPNLTDARAFHAAIEISTGKILVVGGNDSNVLASAELYDPTANTWTPTGSLATERTGFTLIDFNSQVFAIGGSDNGNNPLDSTELYDPNTETWTSSTSSLVTARYGHVAAATFNKIVVAGGRTTGGNVLASAERFSATPESDNLANADTSTFGGAADTEAATLEPNEVICGTQDAGTPGQDFINSFWHTFTPTEDGTLTVSITGNDPDTSVGLYTGTVHPLAEEVCQEGGSDLTASLSAGVTYYIRLATKTGIGSIDFTLDFTSQSGFLTYLPMLIKSGGAKKWTSQTSGVATNLNGVSCPSATTCFAVGSSGVILATTNGGTTWSGQTSGTAQNLNDVSCPSTSTCFAAGDNGTILKTTNGGGTWTSQTSGTSDTLRGISCPTTTFCAAAGGNGRTTVTVTKNGSSWTAANGVLSPNTPTYAVSCPNTTICIIVGDFGRIYAVTSQPALIYKLTLFDVPNAFSLLGVSCPAGSLTCFAVGQGGKIVASTNINNSSSWAAQTSGTANILQDIGCAATSTCNAVGAGGTIRATQDGGSAWASETSNTGATLADVSCPDATCWAVGTGGTILKGQ